MWACWLTSDWLTANANSQPEQGVASLGVTWRRKGLKAVRVRPRPSHFRFRHHTENNWSRFDFLIYPFDITKRTTDQEFLYIILLSQPSTMSPQKVSLHINVLYFPKFWCQMFKKWFLIILPFHTPPNCFNIQIVLCISPCGKHQLSIGDILILSACWNCFVESERGKIIAFYLEISCHIGWFFFLNLIMPGS